MEKKSLVFGSFVADLMARAPHLPVPGETVKGSGFQMGPGGKGFNQAVAAFRAGADVTLAIKLGNDAFGDIAQNMMKELGMCRDYVFQSREHSTGCALIMVGEDSSQNEIVVVPGTSLSFTDAEVHLLEPVIQACEYLLMQLEINMDAMVMAAEYAARHGKKVILNPAPAADLPARLWQMLDIVIPNEVEAEYYTGIPVRSEKDAKKAADWFHSRGVRHVIITLAERGAYLSGGGSRCFVPAYCVDAVDTTGAGDAFCGGLLAALSEGKGLPEAVRFANAAAALSVQKVGTASSMPSLGEIGEIISKPAPVPSSGC